VSEQTAPPIRPEHPVRPVVTDDLERRRATVFFRLLLVIPHLLWIALFGQVAAVVTFVNWFITLFAGKSPDGIHNFVAGYVRYVARVNAYLFLAADPYPQFYLGSQLDPYPVDIEIDPAARQHRLKTLFRLVLAYPAVILLGALTLASAARATGGAFAIGSLMAWFSAVFLGRMPRGLRDLAVWVVGYATQTASYLFLLTDRYPYFGPELHLRSVEPPAREGRAQVVVADDLRRSRLLVFFRLPISFPHIAWLLLWAVLAYLVAIANWICTLVLGRAPRPLARFLSAYIRYATHFGAFFALVGDPFPGFVGKAGSYPIDLEIDPFQRQHRGVTLFRLLLAVPAFLLASATYGILFVTALLTWFVALIRGRAPMGLRNGAAFALGYLAQVTSYMFVLVDRYPMISPVGTWRAAA
jgi:hypothetical protein